MLLYMNPEWVMVLPDIFFFLIYSVANGLWELHFGWWTLLTKIFFQKRIKEIFWTFCLFYLNCLHTHSTTKFFSSFFSFLFSFLIFFTKLFPFFFYFFLLYVIFHFFFPSSSFSILFLSSLPILHSIPFLCFLFLIFFSLLKPWMSIAACFS